jgi:hypothetical protein
VNGQPILVSTRPSFGSTTSPITVAGLSLDDLASIALIALVGLQFYDRFWGRHAR